MREVVYKLYKANMSKILNFVKEYPEDYNILGQKARSTEVNLGGS